MAKRKKGPFVTTYKDVDMYWTIRVMRKIYLTEEGRTAKRIVPNNATTYHLYNIFLYEIEALLEKTWDK